MKPQSAGAKKMNAATTFEERSARMKGAWERRRRRAWWNDPMAWRDWSDGPEPLWRRALRARGTKFSD